MNFQKRSFPFTRFSDSSKNVTSCPRKRYPIIILELGFSQKVEHAYFPIFPLVAGSNSSFENISLQSTSLSTSFSSLISKLTETKTSLDNLHDSSGPRLLRQAIKEEYQGGSFLGDGIGGWNAHRHGVSKKVPLWENRVWIVCCIFIIYEAIISCFNGYLIVFQMVLQFEKSILRVVLKETHINLSS